MSTWNVCSSIGPRIGTTRTARKKLKSHNAAVAKHITSDTAAARLKRRRCTSQQSYRVRHDVNWRNPRPRISFAALRTHSSARKTSTMASPQGSNTRRPRRKKKEVQLIANGDLRLSANQKCWPEQAKMEDALRGAVEAAGYSLVRAHPYKEDQQHGFIQSQKEGMEVFRTGVDPDAPIIVAEAVWQYSHHLLHGLTTHKGPI